MRASCLPYQKPIFYLRKIASFWQGFALPKISVGLLTYELDYHFYRPSLGLCGACSRKHLY
ncbi:Uncharacterised protein [Serratia marcescens]|nr:Uncharacterised protein [Serratia marcescens]CVC61140.1 Uncharacterised protein [Serratia marcescens]CVE34963.1 Uncharacterised protein [Serratia marcescens]CVE82572.1 Uncharacterised protein [Serratia marcescens]